MIRPRRQMNRQNRALLAQISANPAEIAEAAMSDGRLPERNPYAAPMPAPMVPSPTADVAAGLLSNAQKLWLHRRAMWFHEMLGGGFPTGTDADTVATFAATALVGDDYDPITKGPTPGWSASQWQAAHEYVQSNLATWHADAVPPAQPSTFKPFPLTSAVRR